MSRMDARARRGLPGDAQGKAGSLPRSPNRHAMRLVGELGAKVVRAVHETERRDTGGAAGPGTDSDLSWYDFALEYLAMRWPTVAPNTRDETNEGLTAVTKAMVLHTPAGRRTRPRTVRCARGRSSCRVLRSVTCLTRPVRCWRG
jgi:hypothetical protein